MIQFGKALSAWGTAVFNDILKAEIEKLGPDVLPLQQGLTQGSYANADDIKVMIIAAEERPDAVRVKAGIHYTSIIAGCSCADDPTPVDRISEYCEVVLAIDRATAETTVTLLTD